MHTGTVYIYVPLTDGDDCVVLWGASLPRWSDHLTNLFLFVFAHTKDDHDNDYDDTKNDSKGYANFGTNWPVE